jgi:hypothetical protein
MLPSGNDLYKDMVQARDGDIKISVIKEGCNTIIQAKATRGLATCLTT